MRPPRPEKRKTRKTRFVACGDLLSLEQERGCPRPDPQNSPPKTRRKSLREPGLRPHITAHLQLTPLLPDKKATHSSAACCKGLGPRHPSSPETDQDPHLHAQGHVS